MAQAQTVSSQLMGARSKSAAMPAGDHIDPMRLIAFLAMVFGMFMAILDIQIVSASLAEIQAGLSASADEISWVQTSYLIAEVVMIPLSGLLARAFSTRWLFAMCAAGFTFMSFMCGLATNMEEMIVFRALQGFIGGGMIPSVFAAAYTIFPPSRRSMITPLIGLVATLAPTIGPTAGGFLTDALSWHWLFFINVVPGILVTIAVITLVDFDEPNPEVLKTFDWAGLLSMALFLCSLEYVLEEGPSKDWFEDSRIVIGAVASALGGVLFFWRTLTAKFPLVDLTAYLNRNFATGSVASFILGIGLYGLTYLYPVFLGRVRGYSSLQIGETLFLTGMVMMISAPIIGRLTTLVDLRVLMGLGIATFAMGTYLATALTKDWAYGELIIPQVCRGVGLMMTMLPINNLALGTLPPERLKNASGLYNLIRNLGGAVGLALINTMLNERTDLHLARLHETVTAGNWQAQVWLDTVTQRFQDMAPNADLMALKELAAMVRQQALVLAFGDVFLMLTISWLLVLPLVLLIKKPRPVGGAGSGH